MAFYKTLLLLTIIYLHGSSAKTIYKCTPNPKATCTLKNVQIASPEDIDQIELPKNQQVVHFISGNIPLFGEHLYEQLKSTTNLTITKCKVEKLFVGLQLVHLNASNNQLITLQRTSSGSNYSALKVLDLSNNQFAEVSLVLQFVELEELDLSGNAIKSVDLGDFDVLTKLRLLNLGNNRISHWESKHGFHLKWLNQLYLYNTQLLDFNLNDWLLPSLAKLDLSSNQLYYLNGEDLLTSLPNLRRLDLTANRWACHGLSKLLPFLSKHSVALVKEQSACLSNQIKEEGVCCENRYVNYVTMQSQWDVRRLQRELRSMNQSLVAKLDSVRTDQGVQIEALKRQLVEQDETMREMKQNLVQMDRLIDDLLEELYHRQLEADVEKRAKSRGARPLVMPVF